MALATCASFWPAQARNNVLYNHSTAVKVPRMLTAPQRAVLSLLTMQPCRTAPVTDPSRGVVSGASALVMLECSHEDARKIAAFVLQRVSLSLVAE